MSEDGGKRAGVQKRMKRGRVRKAGECREGKGRRKVVGMVGWGGNEEFGRGERGREWRK